MDTRQKKDRVSFLLSAPMIIWTILFVGATIAYVIALSFLKRNPDGYGVVMEFTLENYAKLNNPNYLEVFRRTLLLGAETTLICAALGYPFGYCMAKASPRWRTALMLLVIVPFWTNALIRIYGWRILLVGNGPVNGLLMALGIIDKPLKLMNTHGAVLTRQAAQPVFDLLGVPGHNVQTIRDGGHGQEARDWRLALDIADRLLG